MAQSLAVISFFDDMAEAQQAVQLLLNSGFIRENVGLSTQTGLPANTDGMNDTTANKKNSTGRFLSSLFGGGSDDTRSIQAGSNNEVTRRIGALITVKAQSVEEAKRATGLLNDAGAVDISEGGE